MKDFINIIIDQNGIRKYKDFGFGLILYIHKHMYGDLENIYPFHSHICLTLAFWFIELQIGKDVIESEDK